MADRVYKRLLSRDKLDQQRRKLLRHPKVTKAIKKSMLTYQEVFSTVLESYADREAFGKGYDDRNRKQKLLVETDPDICQQ